MSHRIDPETSLKFKLEDIRSRMDEIEELIDNFETLDMETQFKHLIWTRMRAESIVEACVIGVDRLHDLRSMNKENA